MPKKKREEDILELTQESMEPENMPESESDLMSDGAHWSEEENPNSNDLPEPLGEPPDTDDKAAGEPPLMEFLGAEESATLAFSGTGDAGAGSTLPESPIWDGETADGKLPMEDDGEEGGNPIRPYYMDAPEPVKPQPASAVGGSIPSAPRPQASAARRLREMNLQEQDRWLTPEEREEWNAIYASYRSRSILTGTVIGVDRNTFDMKNQETGELETRTVYSAVIVPHRVKILIPEAEMWLGEDRWPGYVVRGMVGAALDFVILDIDREAGVAVASRRLALEERRRYFRRAAREHQQGDLLACQVLAVGPNRCLVTCNGFDLSLQQRKLSYTAIADLRDKYTPGQELRCVLTRLDAEGISISVKRATTNPFDGAAQRHPLGSRRLAVISGKFNGGVFVALPDGLTVLCNYSRLLQDGHFQMEDKVMIAIERFDYENKLIFGRIMSKLGS